MPRVIILFQDGTYLQKTVACVKEISVEIKKRKVVLPNILVMRPLDSLTVSTGELRFSNEYEKSKWSSFLVAIGYGDNVIDGMDGNYYIVNKWSYKNVSLKVQNIVEIYSQCILTENYDPFFDELEKIKI